MERLTLLPWQEPLWRQVAATRERMPHALLLHGARGIGKRHFARMLAQSLLCESPESPGYACGHCAGCLLLAADNHPDLRWLVPALDQPVRDEAEGDDEVAVPARTVRASRAILIDQVRDVGEFLALAAHRGGRRVLILAPAEALNGPAANALLKLLEEPPAGAIFVAVTDELDAVLPTVRSRCVLLRAPVPRADEALAWLRAAGVNGAEEKLAEAGGAPVGLEVDVEDSRTLAPDLRERLLALLAKGPRLGPADVVSTVPKDVPIAAAIRLLQRWGWDLLAERSAGRVRYYPTHQRSIASVARACEPERLLGWLGRLDNAQATADHPLNARLVVESALIGYLDAIRPER